MSVCINIVGSIHCDIRYKHSQERHGYGLTTIVIKLQDVLRVGPDLFFTYQYLHYLYKLYQNN